MSNNFTLAEVLTMATNEIKGDKVFIEDLDAKELNVVELWCPNDSHTNDYVERNKNRLCKKILRVTGTGNYHVHL